MDSNLLSRIEKSTLVVLVTLYSTNVLQAVADESLTDKFGKIKSYDQIYEWAPNAYKKGTTSSPSFVNKPEENKIDVAHRRANEVRSLMGAFIKEKIDRLRDNENDPDVMKEILGGFCMKDEKTAACKNRYIMINTSILYKIKRGMEESENHIAILNCTKRGADGACQGTTGSSVAIDRLSQGDTASTKLLLPYLPTYQDLQDFAKKYGRKLTAQDYQNWVKSLDADDKSKEATAAAGVKPIKEDFIKTKRVPKEPGSSEMVTVIETGPDGKPKYDEKAFKTALEAYNEDEKAIHNAFKAMKKADSNEQIQKVQKDFQNPIKDPSNEGKKDTDYGIYAQVRGQLVDLANQELARTAKHQEENKGKPAPKPSTKLSGLPSPKTPTVVPAKTYTGTEQVDSGKLRGGHDQSVYFKSESFGVYQVVRPTYNDEEYFEGTDKGESNQRHIQENQIKPNLDTGATSTSTSTNANPYNMSSPGQQNQLNPPTSDSRAPASVTQQGPPQVGNPSSNSGTSAISPYSGGAVDDSGQSYIDKM